MFDAHRIGKGFRNIYLVPFYKLVPGGCQLLSRQTAWTFHLLHRTLMVA